jgi:hypothetical protein
MNDRTNQAIAALAAATAALASRNAKTYGEPLPDDVALAVAELASYIEGLAKTDLYYDEIKAAAKVFED